MAKKIIGSVKLRVIGGSATPAPPVGPALGQRGVNIMEFCKAFNAKTQDKKGEVIPIILTVYADKSFTFVMKQQSAGDLIKKAANFTKGSSKPNKDSVATIKREELRKLAEIKMPDLNTDSLESALTMLEGSAKSMGVKVVD